MNFLSTNNDSEPQILTRRRQTLDCHVVALAKLPDSRSVQAGFLGQFPNGNPLFRHSFDDTGRVVKIFSFLRQVSTSLIRVNSYCYYLYFQEDVNY